MSYSIFTNTGNRLPMTFSDKASAEGHALSVGLDKYRILSSVDHPRRNILDALTDKAIIVDKEVKKYNARLKREMNKPPVRQFPNGVSGQKAYIEVFARLNHHVL